jgi:hypothetical protein
MLSAQLGCDWEEGGAQERCDMSKRYSCRVSLVCLQRVGCPPISCCFDIPNLQRFNSHRLKMAHSNALTGSYLRR